GESGPPVLRLIFEPASAAGPPLVGTACFSRPAGRNSAVGSAATSSVAPMETGRAEAFSDGVFAIAITLLILTIEPPSSAKNLGHELVRLWPSYAAYAVSFLTVGIMWANHHTIFRHFARVDRPLLLLNILLLML